MVTRYVLRRILLFDTIIDGHHPDYLRHLIQYWLHTQPDGELIVVTQAIFEPVFRQLVDAFPSQTAVQFVPISQPEIDHVHQGSVLNRSFREWNLHLAYSQRLQPTHVLLMYFDVFQLGLWLGRKASCAVSGIYFRPDFYYGRSSGAKERLRVLRKKTTLHGVLNRRVLTNLFCLDHSAVPLVRRMNPHVHVLPLPDPVTTYDVTTEEVVELRRELQIDPNRLVFLVFGYLDERKGLEPLLDSLQQLNPALHTKICLLFVGATTPDYQEKIRQRIAEVSPDIQIISLFSEVKGKAIQVFFDLSDYVLTLYQQHVGMASVLIRAAISGKPVLSSDYGYMGQLVKNNQLGAVTDSTSLAAIAALLEQVITDGITWSGASLRTLAEENSDTAFAQTIFDNL